MENIIFNGDLYIKYAPTVVCELNFDMEKKDFAIEGGSVSFEELEQALFDVINNIDAILDGRKTNRNTSFDYSGNFGFYRLSMEDNLFKLTSEDNVISGLYTSEDGDQMILKDANDYCCFETMEEVHERFVSLSDFLVNAKYVGLTLEPKNDDCDKMIVLYEYKDTYLVVTNNGRYSVISKQHPNMKKYEIGDSVVETADKKSIYLEIFSQRIANNGRSK